MFSALFFPLSSSFSYIRVPDDRSSPPRRSGARSPPVRSIRGRGAGGLPRTLISVCGQPPPSSRSEIAHRLVGIDRTVLATKGGREKISDELPSLLPLAPPLISHHHVMDSQSLMSHHILFSTICPSFRQSLFFFPPTRIKFLVSLAYGKAVRGRGLSIYVDCSIVTDERGWQIVETERIDAR